MWLLWGYCGVIVGLLTFFLKYNVVKHDAKPVVKHDVKPNVNNKVYVINIILIINSYIH